MGFFDWLGFGKKEKKIVQYDLDPESIKTHNIIRGQANQIAELQAELAKAKTKESEKRQLDEQKQDEEKIKSYLQEDKKQLDKKNTEKFFSLKTFFSKYLKNESFRKQIKITTFDRSTDLGVFGDFGFSGNQFVILNNKNQKIFGTRELKDLFQSVPALGKDVSSLRIPINLDKDGGWIENLMVWEAPEIIREEEGYKYTKAKKRLFYELLKEKDAQIQQSFADLEESETANTKLQERIDELDIVIKSNEKSGEITRAERVKTAKSVSSIEKMWRDTETELTKMRQISVISEDEIKELEKALDKLRKKAEDEGIALKFDEVVSKLDVVKDLFKQKTVVLPPNQQQNQGNS